MRGLLLGALAAGLAILWSAPSEAAGRRGIVDGQGAVVRTGPAETAARMGKLPPGHKVIVNKVGPHWLQVRFQVERAGQRKVVSGWIARNEVRPVRAPATRSTPDPSPARTPAPDTSAPATVASSAGPAPAGPAPAPGKRIRPPGLRKGLSAEAGPAVTLGRYQFVAPGTSVDTTLQPYAGGYAAMDYFFVPWLGVSVSLFQGTRSVEANILGAYDQSVTGLTSNLMDVNAAAVGRVPLGPTYLYARVGYEYLDIRVQPVKSADGTLLFLGGNTYTGIDVGGGFGIALERFRLSVGADYWLAPSLSESEADPTTGAGVSGNVAGVQGITAELVTWVGISDRLGATLRVRGTQLGAQFEGEANRFLAQTDNAATTETFLSSALAISYQF